MRRQRSRHSADSALDIRTGAQEPLPNREWLLSFNGDQGQSRHAGRLEYAQERRIHA